jgi:hypothetical protein
MSERDDPFALVSIVQLGALLIGGMLLGFMLTVGLVALDGRAATAASKATPCDPGAAAPAAIHSPAPRLEAVTTRAAEAPPRGAVALPSPAAAAPVSASALSPTSSEEPSGLSTAEAAEPSLAPAEPHAAAGEAHAEDTAWHVVGDTVPLE